MKKQILAVLTVFVAVAICIGATLLYAQTDAQMSKEDQYHLRALNSELDLIQTQIQQFAQQVHAQDKVNEKNELMKKICTEAKIDVAKCDVDAATGKVSQKVEPKAEPKSEPKSEPRKSGKE